VSTKSDEWIIAEVLRDEFIHIQSQLNAVDSAVQLEDEAEATIELSARFLAHVAEGIDSQSIEARTALLSNVLKFFTSTYLSEKDIHTITSAFDTETRKTVLSSYYQAVATLAERGIIIPTQPKSALLDAAVSNEVSAFALFGGQGTNEVYFDELQYLYDVYNPFIISFLQTATTDVLVPLAEKEQNSSFYTFGFDVISWLSGAVPRPDVSYLASVPVSFPLIGLTQLVQYLVVCHVANLTPGELRSRLGGATGHSQGIVSAVVIATSSTFKEFTQNTHKALKWLFYCGLRGQQAFPITSLEPSIVQDSIKGGEGTPSPMLSVTGLALKDLEVHITNTNKHLPGVSQLQISLHNGSKAFVVTGPPKALFGLVTSLRKVKASSGLDQSKIPFSQRKPVFSIRFLVVGVPYHSDYISGVTDTVVEEDLEDEELWEAKDLKVPVYSTDNGEYGFGSQFGPHI
jgi:fatty acid synthase subunit alpha